MTIRLSTEVLNDLRARVAELAAFHSFLGSPSSAGGPPAWLIYGTGRPTETRIGFSGAATPAVELLGDEVVPEISATALGLPAGQMIAVTGLADADACEKAPVQAHVLAILSQYVPAPAPFAVPPAPAARAAGPDVEEWFRTAKEIAARLGARVRITIEVDPPAP